MDLSLFPQSRVPTLGSEAKSRRIQFDRFYDLGVILF
jgi:hypothetical protein